jgi:AAA domain
MTYGDDVVTSFYQKCDQLEAARADNRPSALSAMAERIFSAASLQTMTFPPLKFILPGLVPEGATLLVSRPKFGKSWLALDVAIATAAGRFTLGTLKPSAGDVLYLALEDGPRRLQRRITKVLPTFSITWPKNLEIATEWPRADQGGLADIEQWLKANPNARLVTVDTLAQFRKLSNGKGQLYPEDYAAISGLQKLASKYNVGIIIVHHDRKSEADDVFDTVSGTLGLTGAADTILIMKRQAGAVTLYVRGRDIEESEMAMQFDKSSCRWSILGTAADVHRSSERAAVLKALKTAGADGLSVAEIMTGTGSQNRHAMDSLLFRMLEAGEVIRPRRGIYSFQRDASVIGEKERNRGQDIENKAVNPNHTDHTGISAADRLSAANPPTSTLPKVNGQPAKDPWAALDIPSYLRREPLGPPAISAGPDDDLGDLE